MVGRGLRQTRSYGTNVFDKSRRRRTINAQKQLALRVFLMNSRVAIFHLPSSLCRIELKVLASDGVIAFEWPRAHRVHITEWMRGISLPMTLA
jgi:hypothetical protein